MKKYAQLLLILLVYTHYSTNAQQKADKFINYTDGLSDNNISTIIQDRFGFIWIATRNGLNCYDGYSFKSFATDPGDPNSISLNWVTDIAEDKDGNLWLATFGGGLNYFDRRKNMFIRYLHSEKDQNSLSNNTVLKLFFDSKDNLWIGTEEGLNRYRTDDKGFDHFTIKNSNIPNNYISALTEDDRGNLWVGTMGGGLGILGKVSGKFIVFKNNKNNAQSLGDNNIRSLLKDRHGDIWIGTLQNGLDLALQRNNGEVTFQHFKNQPNNNNSLANNSILCLYEDSKRNLWIGTENGGVDLLDRKNGHFIHHINNPAEDNSIASNSIWSICEDKAGGLWFGTFNRGISKWDPNRDKFQYISLRSQSNKSKISPTITSLCEISPGEILIGTDGSGYYLWNKQLQSFKQYTDNGTAKNGLHSNVILKILVDSDKKLWMGSWGAGVGFTSLARLNSGVFSNAFPYENIFSIVQDNDKNMWIGTWGAGLHIVSNDWGKKLDYNPSNDPHSLSSGNIFTIFQDSHARCWIGTLYGLNLASGSIRTGFTFKRFFHDNDDTCTLSSNTVLSIFEDNQENIWFGTGFGLNRYDEKTGRILRVSNKMIQNKEIKAIEEDGSGNLWMSTDNSIARFDPNNNKSTIFDKSDGIFVNGFSVNACLKSTDGYFLFGGSNGLVKFKPDSVYGNNFVPPVFITDFRVFNKSVKPGPTSPLKENISFAKEIRLSYKESVFSFEFVALNYTHPEKNQYAYRLDGLEKEWNYVGNQRNASYSNLDPGEYTFMVKASNNDNLWNETPTQVRIIVSPPFWKSVWFKLLVGFVVAGTTYSWYRGRIKKIRFRLEMREKHHENQKIEAEKEVIRLKNDKLDSELDFKNKELASTTMYIMHKNEKMITIRDQLLQLLPQSNGVVEQKIKQITRAIENDLEDEQNWENFERNFNLIHDNFLKRFTQAYPKITHKDLKMCAFIRMNLSNKEISNLLNITLRSVESSRYRIRKKMDLASDLNLNDYIMRF